jgi:hypothetical protein
MTLNNNHHTPEKKKFGMGIIIIFAFACLMVITFLPLAILMFLGFLPFFFVAMVDQDPYQCLTYSVGILNGAIVGPFSLIFLMEGLNIDHTFVLIQNPTFWISILATTVLGCVFTYIIRPIIREVLLMRSYGNIDKCKEQRKELESIWGKTLE